MDASPFLNEPVLISGPFVSSKIATDLLTSLAACLIFLILAPCSAKSPLEKLRRATSIPDSIKSFKISTDSEAGPIVQTIFVLRIYLHPPTIHSIIKWIILLIICTCPYLQYVFVREHQQYGGVQSHFFLNQPYFL